MALGDRAATSLFLWSEDFPSLGVGGELASASGTMGLCLSLLLGSYIKHVPRTSLPGGDSKRCCVVCADWSFTIVLCVAGQLSDHV